MQYFRNCFFMDLRIIGRKMFIINMVQGADAFNFRRASTKTGYRVTTPPHEQLAKWTMPPQSDILCRPRTKKFCKYHGFR